MDTVPKIFIPWNTAHPDIAAEYAEKNRATAASERDKLVDRWMSVAERPTWTSCEEHEAETNLRKKQSLF